MNERIRELVRQAVIAVDDPFPGNPLNDELEKMYIPDCFAEKFAELIVRECMNVVENVPYGYSDYRNQIEDSFRLYCIENLKQHFGVEG
jgi:hypothetical protein